MHIFRRTIPASGAAQRNCGPIFDTIKPFIEPNKVLLEISSGSGYHIKYFAERLPDNVFQPSEIDDNSIMMFRQYLTNSELKNICEPVFADVSKHYAKWQECGPFPGEISKRKFADCKEFFDYILNINMIHITPFKCTLGLFVNSRDILKPGGLLFTYGPYSVNGVLTPESNVQFNENLKMQNKEWGIRDIEELKEVAKESSISLLRTFDLPANNKLLVWQKNL